MPYISKDDRIRLDIRLGSLFDSLCPGDRGEYNYVISVILHEFVADRCREIGECYDPKPPLKYAALNDALGLIEAVKASFIHTVYNPYEDKKRLENGGISHLDQTQLEDVR